VSGGIRRQFDSAHNQQIITSKNNKTRNMKCLNVYMVSFFLFLTSLGLQADTITLTASNLPPVSFYVPSNVVAQIIHSSISVMGSGKNTGSYLIEVVINGQTAIYGQSATAPYQVENLPTIAGPATITLVNTTYIAATNIFSSLAVCTIQTSPASSTLPYSPSAAVVIPNDNGGPVTIILESSTDLVNWTAALPGTYGTTSTNRFFRVRATR
jgi:hypothetical protein